MITIISRIFSPRFEGSSENKIFDESCLMEFLLFIRIHLVVIGKRTSSLSVIELLLVLIIEKLMRILVICTYVRLVNN